MRRTIVSLLTCLLLTGCTVGIARREDLTPAAPTTPAAVPTDTPQPTATASMPAETPQPTVTAAATTTSSGDEWGVTGWYGEVIDLPEGSAYDDYLVLEPRGSGQVGLVGADEDVQAQIVALREEEAPGNAAHFWGTLTCGVDDYAGRQLVVTRLLAEGPSSAPTFDLVEGWEGVVFNYPYGAQFDRYFALVGDFPGAYGVGHGIDSRDPTLEAQLQSLGDSRTVIRIWGELTCGVIAPFGSQIVVDRIEIVEQPASAALSSLATASASSHLAADQGGRYDPGLAIDGVSETAWVEGVDGPGVGEWIRLDFPIAVEIHSVGLYVGYGYDRDWNILLANNRIRRVTLVFSTGEEVEATLDDAPGMQTIPLIRASHPSIETTYVQVTIEETYAGTTYDDTCLSEIEVWGRAE